LEWVNPWFPTANRLGDGLWLLMLGTCTVALVSYVGYMYGGLSARACILWSWRGQLILLHTESHTLVHLKDKKSSWVNNKHYRIFLSPQHAGLEW
jgi:hypothetical protein